MRKQKSFIGHREQGLSLGDSLGCSVRTVMPQSHSMCPSRCPDRSGLLTHLPSCNFVPGPLFRERFLLAFCLMRVSLCRSCQNNVPQTGGLEQQKWIGSQIGRPEGSRKVQEGWFSLRAVREDLFPTSLLGLQLAVFSLCLLVVSPLCMSGCPDSFFFQGQPSYSVRAHPNDIM